jgi:hypothetical protein
MDESGIQENRKKRLAETKARYSLIMADYSPSPWNALRRDEQGHRKRGQLILLLDEFGGNLKVCAHET